MIEFVDRWRDEYDIAWWVPAADPPLVADRLAELAETLGLAAPTDRRRGGDGPTARRAAASRSLAAGPRRCRGPTAADPVPARRHPATCWSRPTTRHGRRHATAVAVGRLNREESVAVLQSRCPALPAVEADRVAAALDDVPQACRCGRALDGDGVSIDYLLRMLHRPRSGYRRSGGSDPLPSIALDQLSTDDPGAWNLVAALAWLGPDPVPAVPARRSQGTNGDSATTRRPGRGRPVGEGWPGSTATPCSCTRPRRN